MSVFEKGVEPRCEPRPFSNCNRRMSGQQSFFPLWSLAIPGSLTGWCGRTPDPYRFRRERCLTPIRRKVAREPSARGSNAGLLNPPAPKHAGVTVDDGGLTGCDGQLWLVETNHESFPIVPLEDHLSWLG